MPERIDIVKHLWEVALVDGHLHRMETMMIDRVAIELGLSASRRGGREGRGAEESN